MSDVKLREGLERLLASNLFFCHDPMGQEALNAVAEQLRTLLAQPAESVESHTEAEKQIAEQLTNDAIASGVAEKMAGVLRSAFDEPQRQTDTGTSESKYREAIESLRQKFTSGNDVPVTEARITRAEYEALSQPTEAVELTDEELVRAMYHGVVAADSTVINDVEGMVQDLRDNEPETLAVVAGLRAVITAHEAKRIQS